MASPIALSSTIDDGVDRRRLSSEIVSSKSSGIVCRSSDRRHVQARQPLAGGKGSWSKKVLHGAIAGGAATSRSCARAMTPARKAASAEAVLAHLRLKTSCAASGGVPLQGERKLPAELFQVWRSMLNRSMIAETS